MGILFPEHAHDFVSRDKQYGGISVLEFITAGKNLKTQANIYDKFVYVYCQLNKNNWFSYFDWYMHIGHTLNLFFR